jgi:hypothetical protein
MLILTLFTTWSLLISFFSIGVLSSFLLNISLPPGCPLLTYLFFGLAALRLFAAS